MTQARLTQKVVEVFEADASVITVHLTQKVIEVFQSFTPTTRAMLTQKVVEVWYVQGLVPGCVPTFPAGDVPEI